MFWKKPHIPKIYEAITAIADKRVEVYAPGKAKVYSSSRNKYHEVAYDLKMNMITANDNSAYYADTLSYPMIATLLIEGVLLYDKELLKPLAGIVWKDINTKFRNNFENALAYELFELAKQGFDREFIEQEVKKIYDQILELKLSPLGEKQKPPEGY